MNIDELLQAPAGAETMQKLSKWIEDTQNKIARGDLAIGILDMDEAMKIPLVYGRLIELGDNEAMEGLAEWCTFPSVGEPDYPAAEMLHRQMIERGIPSATYRLARFRWFFRRDELNAAEKKETLLLLDEGIADKLSDALILKGYMLADGFDGKPDVPEAVRYFLEAADMGNADAMFELYVYYSTGNGVPEDAEAALKYNKMAAGMEHDRAMYNMGSFYATGRYVEKNIDTAVEWYKKASETGNAKAGFTLGVMYAAGFDVEVDPVKAAEYFNEAEMNGYDSGSIADMREKYGLAD